MLRDTLMNLAKKFKSPADDKPDKPQVVVKESIGGCDDGGAWESAGNVFVDNNPETMKVAAGREKEEIKLSKVVVKKLQKLSTEELEIFLSSDDNFVIDCLLDSDPQINKLKRERDSLNKQVIDLAKFNYAREPEHVRDRAQLRKTYEEAAVKQRLTIKLTMAILNKLKSVEACLVQHAREAEERSEQVAHEFLKGQKGYDDFVTSYIDVRKEASRKRETANKFVRELNILTEHALKPAVDTNSPIPTPRQRKRAIKLN